MDYQLDSQGKSGTGFQDWMRFTVIQHNSVGDTFNAQDVKAHLYVSSVCNEPEGRVHAGGTDL